MKTINIARSSVVLAVIAILFGPIARQTHALRVPLKLTAQPVQAVEPDPPVNGKIAFTHFNFPHVEQIATVNEDGSNLTLLTDFVNAEGPAFSRDGSQIAFSMVAGTFQLWLRDADGSNQHRLTNSARNDYNPSWSPDGSKIAFAGDNQIYVINSDGTNEVLLSD